MNMDSPGELILTSSGSDGKSTNLRFQVEVTGLPTAGAINPTYLARALEISGTLRLSDGTTPYMTEGPGGRFCVVMPMRVSAHRTRSESAET